MRSTSLCGLLATIALSGCGASQSEHDHAAGHEEAGAAPFERGPHGGRLLRAGDFALEVRIFEAGIPPEYHLYGYENDRPLKPTDFDATVTLKRLGGRIDRFAFKPTGDFLRGDGVVHEPHSFDVEVIATHKGREYKWAYDSYEGRTAIAPEIAEASGLRVETAGPATLREQIELTGVVQSRADRLAQVHARFPGVVREVRADVGDRVARGVVLARVQSNESLETYEITSPISGTVLERTAQVGEVTGSAPLFVVSDLSSVWAELDAYGADLKRLTTGQSVDVEAVDESATGSGKIALIPPVASRASQSVRARVPLANDQQLWRPGQFVRGRVTVSETSVPLAVRNSALQQFRDFQVVFARVGNTYEVRMLELGRRDREFTEVLGGLEPGVQYVTDNSFLVKADVEKSGASHDH